MVNNTFLAPYTSTSELIKIMIKRHLSKVAPSILGTINLYCLTRYGKDAITLFAESPCRFYTFLRDVYKGSSIEMIIKLFIESISNDPKTTGTLVGYVKACNDRAFSETIINIVQNKQIT